MMSVITPFDGLTFTNGDGQSGQDLQVRQQNGTGIATGAVLASGGSRSEQLAGTAPLPRFEDIDIAFGAFCVMAMDLAAILCHKVF